MKTAKPKHWRPSRFNTIFVKCSVAAGLAVVLVAATMNFISTRMTQKVSHDSMSHQAVEVSTLMSLQLGGTIKFGNSEAAKQMLDSVVEAGRPAAVGGAVLDVSGEILFISPELDAHIDDVRALAMQTFETGEAMLAPDGLSASAPSVFGPDNQMVGAVVTVWTDAHQNAVLALVQLDAMLAAFGVAVVALGLFSVFMSRHFSIPLRNMQAAVASIEAGKYTTQIAEQARGDEIGGIAARLVNFRDALADGAEAQRNSAFRGAAFQGSTAAMMLIDENHTVVFANPSCTALLDELFEDVSQVWPDVEKGTFAGRDLSKFSPLTGLLDKVAKDGETALPLSRTFKLGESHLSTNLNAAVDASGKMIGAVVEWADISSVQKTAAVMETVDRKQVRLEFDKSGQCVFANETALTALTSGTTSLTTQTIFDVFGAPQDDAQLQGDWQSRVLSGEETSGVFNSDILATGNPSIFDGSFGAVLSPDGSTERLIFLGTDVSKARKIMREADEQRRKSQEEQKIVVDALGSALLDLSQGDLSTSIQDHFPAEYDQLRSDFNTATASLSQTVGLVSSNTEEIRKETQDITTAADEMSRRTERQAAALEEAAAALDHITTSVQSASQGAEQANDAAILAQRSAEEGGEVARKAVAAMDGIKKSSSEISKITSVIDEIAFQTNLLALNAGVEAARAGAAGRGFAVVATEVRALAQRSSDAASEINALISSSGEQVDDGVDLVDRTGIALDAIENSVSDITNRVSQIATSSREQASGLIEINTSVVELDQVTQQNAAVFDKTTAASQALTVKADALAAAVSQFQLSKNHVTASKVGLKAENAVTEGAIKTTASAVQQAELAKVAVGQKHQPTFVAQSEHGAVDTWEEF